MKTRERRAVRPGVFTVACLLALSVVSGCNGSSSDRAGGGPYRGPSACGRSTRVVRVSDSSELRRALDDAHPGDVIWLGSAAYKGAFTATRSGTRRSHITLCGTSSAVLDSGSVNHHYTLHLDGADYTDVRGLTIERGLKGIMADGWSHGTIDHVTVRDIGEEGIHLRRSSSNDTISNCRISDTGSADLHDAHHSGEGIYIGSSYNNWDRYTGGHPDSSDNVRITHNTFSRTAAENVDVKEGTVGGLISRNTFDGSGMDPKAADSWVDIKGNHYTVSRNRGFSAPVDGFQTHVQLPGWGVGNVFTANVVHVDAGGYGFDIDKAGAANVVRCNNVVTSAASGRSDVRCR
ncbi:right-handed parallel beta-helix repeat-containing protein [Nocardioides panacis]|uniref:Right-handed parallel beta-helix repeat-containing protein n=1 Tax=Nocardioides panacis TaxID=2849501 RepID=A0A975T1T1_9ACTN|nr:right-handed parallel beta-helix repeat-containing protein [Nocardioides panacis]QWZ09971.1 right-handed parallel beta-helix repeat-containing protein [Nocardioides panacis]